MIVCIWVIYFIREGCPGLSFSFIHVSVVRFIIGRVIPFRTSLKG